MAHHVPALSSRTGKYQNNPRDSGGSQAPESHVTIIETGRNWKYRSGENKFFSSLMTSMTNIVKFNFTSAPVIFLTCVIYRMLPVSPPGVCPTAFECWMCFVRFVYFLSKASGHIVIIIPKIGNIVCKIMFSFKKLDFLQLFGTFVVVEQKLCFVENVNIFQN